MCVTADGVGAGRMRMGRSRARVARDAEASDAVDGRGEMTGSSTESSSIDGARDRSGVRDP